MRRLKALLEQVERPVAVVGQVVTVLAAIAALAISLISLQQSSQPRQEAAEARSAAVDAVLGGIVGGSVEDLQRARAHAASESVADDFLWFLGEIRRVADAKARANTIEPDPSGGHVLCLPGYRVLWQECLRFSDFAFDEQGDVSDFSIDGIPLRAMFTYVGDYDLDRASVDAHVVAGLIAYVDHPRSDRVTSLVMLDRTALDAGEVSSVQVGSLRFEDDDEEEVVGVQLGSQQIGAFDEALWAIQVPEGGFVGFDYAALDAEGAVVPGDHYFWIFGP